MQLKRRVGGKRGTREGKIIRDGILFLLGKKKSSCW